MTIAAQLHGNLYKDSVALMRISQELQALAGIRRATLLMGTPANRAVLAAAGLMDAALAAAAPVDVMAVVDAASAAEAQAALARAARLLEGTPVAAGTQGAAAAAPPRSQLASACTAFDARLAQISVPGPYAAAEAMKALRGGRHVFLFSDNVPLAQEQAIKAVASRKGLLVMGPDCGTAILGGVPLGFANRVRSGGISVVGASGTGIQEVTCRVHAMGQGIRHAIGTGSRDPSQEIGGATLLAAIDLLTRDEGTSVIAIVSKPPAPEVARQAIERLAASGKPCVALFLGMRDSTRAWPHNVTAAHTLLDAAAAAVARAEGQPFKHGMPGEDDLQAARSQAQLLRPTQRHLRGLYSGGTFASEAQGIWAEAGLASGSEASAQGNLAIDLGDDEFTVGRPHPMIDPTERVAQIARHGADASVGVMVLDVVLGYAAHDDPAAPLAHAVQAAKAQAAREGRHLCVVAFVCGTDQDPQDAARQARMLSEAGCVLAASSTAAAQFAAEIVLRARANRAVMETRQ